MAAKKPSQTATAQTGQQMFEAIGVMLAFVFGLTLVAGAGKTAGRIAVLIMVALVIAEGIAHLNPFISWATDHPLTHNQAVKADANG